MLTATGNVYWSGVVLVATGLLILLISGFSLRKHEREQADDFAHSFGMTVDGTFRRFTYRSFRLLPPRERDHLVQFTALQRWYVAERHRHSQRARAFYRTRRGRLVLLWRRLRRLR